MENLSKDNVLAHYNGPHRWLKDNILFLTVHGSRAYGTNNENSDIDIKGIAIPDKEYLLGFKNNFEQAEIREPYDSVIYSLQKFCKLASDCNPSIIEILFTDPKDWIYASPLYLKLYENRHLFLSKKVKNTFVGYALSQLKRAKTHREWLLNPPSKKPSREDFNLPVNKKVNISTQGAIEEMISSGITFDADIMTRFQQEKKYLASLNNWKQYENWKQTRNKSRAIMEDKMGFDCFVDDTEFLTKDGFKNFTEINQDDELGTIFLGSYKHRQHLGIEFQKPLEKFSGTFSGNLYNFIGNHLDVCVTPNHRMVVRRCSRKNGQIIDDAPIFETASRLGDCYQFLVSPEPKKNSQNIAFEQAKDLPDDFSFDNYLRLMGWYLSDGCALFRNGNIKEIRISQKKGGKLSWHMARFCSQNKKIANCSINEYVRKPSICRNYEITERILSVRNKNIKAKILKDCGTKKDKRIPLWVYSLSKRQMNILLTSLSRGDGTIKTHNTKESSEIYYSNNKLLADDVQRLAFTCGYETNLYGPYTSMNSKINKECTMYHVHIRKTNKRYKTLTKSNNLKKIFVTNQKIVCFSVPNGTLITRRNGCISIQGNCKNAMHLIRLLNMGEEILNGKGVLTKRPDAQFLKDIRNGSMTYEQIIDLTEEKRKKIDEAYLKSVLPEKSDKTAIDRICVEIAEEFLFDKIICG